MLANKRAYVRKSYSDRHRLTEYMPVYTIQLRTLCLPTYKRNSESLQHSSKHVIVLRRAHHVQQSGMYSSHRGELETGVTVTVKTNVTRFLRPTLHIR